MTPTKKRSNEDWAKNMRWLIRAKKACYSIYKKSPAAYFLELKRAGDAMEKRLRSIHRLALHIW